jgi:hypothetical protein
MTLSPARPDLALHVGMGKTGTSSIQFFLRDNREALARAGVLFPRSPGGARHGKVSLFAKSDEDLETSPEWARQKQQDPARFRRVFRRRLLGEVNEAGLPRVLLTDEVLFGSAGSALRRLRRFLDRWTEQTRVIAYLRRQDDHMVSRYQEGVKIGWVERLDDWFHEDMTDLYDYAGRLRLIQQALEPDELVVRRYEREAFTDGSLLQDFLDAAAIDLRAAELAQVTDRNKSLGAEEVEFLRLYNLHRVRTQEARPGLIDNRAIVPSLAAAAEGPTLSLPSSSLEQWMHQWEASNREVATQWVGDPADELFRTPRRTEGTTTEQRLDPARVDHFADVLELDDDERRALRRLAADEARRD